MTAFFTQSFGVSVAVSRTAEVPDFNVNYGADTKSIERLTSEPIGTFTLVLSNVVAGSRYRVEVAGSGALVAEGVAASSTVTLTNLNYYTVGNANNSMRIKVRKGTASPYYKDFETQATAQAGTVTSYIAQIADE